MIAERHSWIQPGQGREEVRTALLRPALLYLREAKGSAAVAQVLHKADLKSLDITQENRWVSLSRIVTVLKGVKERVGLPALSSRASFVSNPEVLGPQVRLLRNIHIPPDAYSYYCNNASENIRIGHFTLEEVTAYSALVRYTPEEETELEQAEDVFVAVLRAELKSLPMLWGLAEAQLKVQSCISEGDLSCLYQLTWKRPPRHLAVLGALATGSACGAIVGLIGTPLVAAITGLTTSLLGGAAGHLWSRLNELSLTRQRERNRVRALEYGLEQRGQFQSATGDLSGSILGGKYRILNRVGSGGIGTVYAAEHIGLGIQVAVKLLRGAAAADASEVARLRREARVQMSIEHANIVRTFDLDQMPDGTLYVVMELLKGVSLLEQLKQQSPLPPGFAIPLSSQACRGLSAAHRLGAVHRDLKPGNIFLCEEGSVKVLDFGMSHLAEDEALTQDGYTLGTPEYMSPEQCRGTEVDHRSDIYTLGILMFESLTGDLPFPSENPRAMLEHQQRTLPKSMRASRPDLEIPEKLDEIVLSCLKKSPTDRPASAQALERLLIGVHPGSVRHNYPTDTPRSGRSPRSA